MILNVIISTYNEGIDKVSKILWPYRSDVKYIISHQYTDEIYLNMQDKLLNRPDVAIYPVFGKGLSKNRNNGMKYANGDIAIIADDDVRYLENSFNIIINIFEREKNLDLALFKIKTLEGEPEYKNYPKDCYQISKKKKHSFSSIEIAVRVESVKREQVQFDERFGIGNKYIIGGEEQVFIEDCIAKGFLAKFFPLFIVSHPYESSVKINDKFSIKRLITLGAVEARTNGVSSIWHNIKKLISAFLRLDFKNKPVKSFLFKLVGNLYVFLS